MGQNKFGYGLVQLSLSRSFGFLFFRALFGGFMKGTRFNRNSLGRTVKVLQQVVNSPLTLST